MNNQKPTKDQLEAISLMNDGNFNFLVKLMYMLRSGQVSISEPNLDIYKKVIGAIAKDNIESATKREELIDKMCDLMIEASNSGMIETADVGKLNMWLREKLT